MTGPSIEGGHPPRTPRASALAPSKLASFATILLAAFALVLAVESAALAQAGGMGGMPSKEEIEKRVKEEFDKLPTQTTEVDGAKITYKAVPADPIEIIKAQVPAGAGNAEALAKQYLPMARPYIEKYMGEVGTLVVDREWKLKSVKVKPGTYTFGLVMDELTPVAIRISGGDLKAAVTIPLKLSNAKQPSPTLAVELKVGKKPEEFTAEVLFGKVLGTSPKLTFSKASS